MNKEYIELFGHVPVVQEVIDKWSEHLEMAGDCAPALLISLLGELLTQEKSLTDYYKKVMRSQGGKYECSCATNR